MSGVRWLCGLGATYALALASPARAQDAPIVTPLAITIDSADPAPPAPPTHSAFVSLQGIGAEWYSAVVSAPILTRSPLVSAPGPTPTGAGFASTPGSQAPILRAFGMLLYMRFPHVRSGLGLQLTFNDPQTPLAVATPVDQSGPLPAPVNVLAATGNFFVDVEAHIGPLVPYAGLDAAAGGFSFSQSTPAGAPDLGGGTFGYAAGRAGARLYLGDNLALGAFVEQSMVGARVRQVALALTFPEVPAH